MLHDLAIFGSITVILVCATIIYRSIQSALDADRDDPDIWRDE